MQARRGDEAAALASLRRAVALSEADLGAQPGNAAARSRLARIQGDLVERLQRAGEHREAAARARSSLEILEALVAAEPHNARYRRDLIYALNVGSDAIERAGDADSANRARRRSLELSEALLAIEPGNQGDRIALTYTLQYLGVGLVRSGETNEGLERLRQACRSAEVTLRAGPESAFARGRVAAVQAELALTLSQLRIQRQQMCAAARQSVGLWSRLDREGRLAGEDRPHFDQVRALLQGCTPDGR
jgi:tetratricopeptide (TPR) repeat protein